MPNYLLFALLFLSCQDPRPAPERAAEKVLIAIRDGKLDHPEGRGFLPDYKLFTDKLIDEAYKETGHSIDISEKMPLYRLWFGLPKGLQRWELVDKSVAEEWRLEDVSQETYSRDTKNQSRWKSYENFKQANINDNRKRPKFHFDSTKQVIWYLNAKLPSRHYIYRALSDRGKERIKLVMIETEKGKWQCGMLHTQDIKLVDTPAGRTL